MLEQVKLDDGWIPMSTMLKFQRLSRLSKDPDAVAAAMKHSQLVEVDTSGTEPKLRRSPEIPLPEFNAERRKAVMERTVYCKVSACVYRNIIFCDLLLCCSLYLLLA